MNNEDEALAPADDLMREPAGWLVIVDKLTLSDLFCG
jgi:hypothetical protein